MKIGMNLPVMVPGLDRDRLLPWCERIDAGFYSSLAAGERMAFFNPDITVALSAAAAITKRVKLVFGVAVLPIHNAVLFAKQVATLDVISDGRVVVGVGVGGREQDYQAVGASFERRLGRIAEGVATMRRVWAQDTIVDGALPVGPAPVQTGGPEILAGSLMPQSIRRAAKWADGLCGFSFGPSADEIGFQYETAREAWTAEGRPSPRLVMSFWYALGDGATAQMDAYLSRYLNFMAPSARESLKSLCVTTSPQALKDAVKQVEDLGTDELILVPTTVDPDDVHRVADLLA